MNGLVVALPSEAGPLIEAFNLKKSEEVSRFEIYTSPDLSLIVSGIGRIRSAVATTLLCARVQPDNLVNVGICGSRNEERVIGNAYIINKVSSPDLRDFYPERIVEIPVAEAGLTTFDRVVSNDMNLPPTIDLIDMEGSGFCDAASCFLQTHRIHLLKVVSDHLDLGHISREFVSDLMTSNAALIGSFLKSLPAAKTPLLSEEETGKLKMLTSSLNLTETQKHQLHDWTRSAKVRGRSILPALDVKDAGAPRSKADKKKLLESIRLALE